MGSFLRRLLMNSSAQWVGYAICSGGIRGSIIKKNGCGGISLPPMKDSSSRESSTLHFPSSHRPNPNPAIPIPKIRVGKSSSDDPLFSRSVDERCSKWKSNNQMPKRGSVLHSCIYLSKPTSGERLSCYLFFDMLYRKYAETGDKTDPYVVGTHFSAWLLDTQLT